MKEESVKQTERSSGDSTKLSRGISDKQKKQAYYKWLKQFSH